MSKNPYIINPKNICIKLPVEPSEEFKKVVLDNSHMYNIIRNDFVEEAQKHKGEYNMYDTFDPSKFKTEYYHTVEIPEKRYDYYCTGLSEQVASDFIQSRSMLRTKNRKVFDHKSTSKLGEYHFKKFDPNRYTFRVKLKPSIGPNGNVRTRLIIHSKKKLSFIIMTNVHTDTCNRSKQILDIKLKEPLYDDITNDINPLYTRYYTINGEKNDCMFYLSDIKDICFKYELGKYYIQLFINTTYMINKKSLEYSRGRFAGIDTGIHHPVTIYDGTSVKYLSMDDETARKIHYLERRIKRLDKHLQYKIKYNEENNISTNSKNIQKLITKMRKLYKRISNIKDDWVKKTCKEIATTYSAITVDSFEQPDKTTKMQMSSKVRNRINYANRFHSMWYFNDYLKHACIKYGCKYIQSPENTTRTCSVCGYVNDHLKLEDRNLVCDKCGSIVERDMNAAKNCYYYLLDNE